MLANSMALAGNFGTGEVTAHDLAAGLQGSVVKDEEKDRVVWQEYLSNVLKKRGAEWRPLFTACAEHNVVSAPGRSTSSACGICRRRAPGSCAQYPRPRAARGRADRRAGRRRRADSRHDAQGDASRRSRSWPTPTRCRCARSSIRWPATAPSTRRSVWAKENNAERRVHRPAVRHLPRPAGCGGRTDRAGSPRRRAEAAEARPPTEAASRRREQPAAAAPEPRRSLYERFAELAGERDYDTYWERHFEHNLERRQLPPGRVRVRPGAARAGRRRAALAGGEPRPRSVHAAADRGGDRRGTQAGEDRRRRRRVSRAGPQRRVPGDDRRGTGVAAAAGRAS